MILVCAEWKEKPVRLGHGEGEAGADNSGEGGRNQIQLIRSLDFILVLRKLLENFKPESKRPGLYF